ncbi:hypothetical protein P389DRAFT_209899 [Cystobasidium minutum MCA 4210]|uniref:uncharacterized protein n=1 Tax=Cystobasidium minutum MCA 4210 TaxID=1397322 RepID=UPI0034CECCFD|eukprot:jgi/Rhomi1/209899/estExt_Genemark1.C_3_t20069
MPRLSSGQGLYPSIIISAFCLALVFVASLFHREAVTQLSDDIADRARLSYDSVRQKVYEKAYGVGGGGNAPLPAVISPYGGDKKAYLEPEWEWARDVSIVYTWVNGSDPKQRAQKQKYGIALESERDRDNDDLRHSFRALNKYMPWHTGPIFLVTPPGQYPNWLELNNPRIHLINQEDLLQPYEKPSFNSNCFESLFHLIAGLSEQFIVMNDDYFFGKPVHPSDFFALTPAPSSSSASSSSSTSSAVHRRRKARGGYAEDMDELRPEVGIKMFLEPTSYGYADSWKGEDQWPKSVRLTAQVVKETYGEIFNERTRITEHSPFVLDKRALQGIHQRFNMHLRRNCQHKTRASDDVIPPFLHHQWIIQEGSRSHGIKYEIVTGKSKFFEWILDTERNIREFKNIIESKNPPTFFNINDKMGFDSNNADKIRLAQNQLKRVMEEWLPDPSEFERVDRIECTQNSALMHSCNVVS